MEKESAGAIYDWIKSVEPRATAVAVKRCIERERRRRRSFTTVESHPLYRDAAKSVALTIQDERSLPPQPKPIAYTF